MTIRSLFFILLFLVLNFQEAVLSKTTDETTLIFPPYLHTYGIRKATRFHLFVFTKNSTKFKDPQDLAVARLLAWEDTTTNKDDDEVTVYGVNSGENNIIYNTSMKAIGIYGKDEPEEARLNAPNGITANESGDVLVADTGNHRIVRLYNSGSQLEFVRAFGKQGTGFGEFNHPYDVAMDLYGTVYVTDTENNRIQVFDFEDRFIREIGWLDYNTSFLDSPKGVALIDGQDKWSYYDESFLVVVDSLNQRLQKVSVDGQLVARLNTKQFGYPEADLQYLDIDYYGSVYVTDQKNHCIHKFNNKLEYLTTFGKYGSGDNEFIEPRGFTIYRRFGQVFVAEKMGAQYYWIGIDVQNFAVEYRPEINQLDISFFITEPGFVTAEIYDESDNLVTRFFRKRRLMTGKHHEKWITRIYPLRLTKREKAEMKIGQEYQKLSFIPFGKYKLVYKFEPTYSSYHFFVKEKSFGFEIKQPGE